ncbi:MAG TPA: hypothetical protein VJ925_12950 [Longimicrobiales bacterium]|nr:hypothetical protein [Longimicrobiales bacterium]
MAASSRTGAWSFGTSRGSTATEPTGAIGEHLDVRGHGVGGGPDGDEGVGHGAACLPSVRTSKPPRGSSRYARDVRDRSVPARHRWEAAFAKSQDALGKLAERARQEYAEGETRRVLQQSEDGIDVEQFDSAEGLFEDLGI